MFLRGIREIETALTHSISETFTKTEHQAAERAQSVSNQLALSLPKIPVAETGFDQVGVAGKPGKLSAKFEMNIPGPFNPDLSGKNVEFFINGRLVGTSKTDSDGRATIDYTPAQNGRYDFTYRIADSRYSDPQGKATLYVDPPRPTLVFDIDGTLSNLPDLQVPFSGGKAPAFDKSPEVLRELAKDYNIIYLTARDEGLTDLTRQFLERNGFPKGAVLFNDFGLETVKKLGQLNPANHGKFKAEVIQDLQKRGINIAAGVGNASTDAAAYELSGLPSFIFGPGYTGDVTGNRSPELPNSTIFGNYSSLPSLVKQAPQPRQLSAEQKAVLNLVYYGDDEKVRGVTDPQLSAARPEEKAALIERLIDGVTQDKDEQAILRILRSEVKNPARFKQIIDIVGMRTLENNLDGQEYRDFQALVKQARGMG